MKHLLTALALAIGTAEAITIDAVYFGQTHVLKASDPYFGLVGNRNALIKARGRQAARDAGATTTCMSITPSPVVRLVDSRA